MLYLGTFFNQITNALIRNLDMKLRIVISIIFICLAIYSVFRLVKSISKELDTKKSIIKFGWLILALLSMTISVLYIVL